jgi:hypothetical protein
MPWIEPQPCLIRGAGPGRAASRQFSAEEKPDPALWMELGLPDQATLQAIFGR